MTTDKPSKIDRAKEAQRTTLLAADVVALLRERAETAAKAQPGATEAGEAFLSAAERAEAFLRGLAAEGDGPWRLGGGHVHLWEDSSGWEHDCGEAARRAGLDKLAMRVVFARPVLDCLALDRSIRSLALRDDAKHKLNWLGWIGGGVGRVRARSQEEGERRLGGAVGPADGLAWTLFAGPPAQIDRATFKAFGLDPRARDSPLRLISLALPEHAEAARYALALLESRDKPATEPAKQIKYVHRVELFLCVNRRTGDYPPEDIDRITDFFRAAFPGASVELPLADPAGALVEIEWCNGEREQAQPRYSQTLQATGWMDAIPELADYV